MHFMQPDIDVAEMTLMALQNGYYHLDTAEGNHVKQSS